MICKRYDVTIVSQSRKATLNIYILYVCRRLQACQGGIQNEQHGQQTSELIYHRRLMFIAIVFFEYNWDLKLKTSIVAKGHWTDHNTRKCFRHIFDNACSNIYVILEKNDFKIEFSANCRDEPTGPLFFEHTHV